MVQRWFFSVIAALLLIPSGASACVWNVAHKGNPFPPCEVKDLALVKRIDQMNVQLVAKVATVVQNIIWVKKEVAQWHDSYETAKAWRARFEQHYGTLTASPLPSMIAYYNRNAPLASYLKLNENGDWAVSLDPVDFREITEQFRARLSDRTALIETYYQGLPKDVTDDIAQEYDWLRGRVTGRVTEATDYRRHFSSAADSLKATGDRLAGRYIDATSPDGMSEAQITQLSAVLSRLRGTSVQVEAAALRARMQATGTAAARGARLREHQIDMTPPAF